jgi:hypothetical protein
VQTQHPKKSLEATPSELKLQAILNSKDTTELPADLSIRAFLYMSGLVCWETLQLTGRVFRYSNSTDERRKTLGDEAWAELLALMRQHEASVCSGQEEKDVPAKEAAQVHLHIYSRSLGVSIHRVRRPQELTWFTTAFHMKHLASVPLTPCKDNAIESATEAREYWMQMSQKTNAAVEAKRNLSSQSSAGERNDRQARREAISDLVSLVCTEEQGKTAEDRKDGTVSKTQSSSSKAKPSIGQIVLDYEEETVEKRLRLFDELKKVRPAAA